ncbi:DUF6482 family protein [Oceanospirillum beijerinckii]|uniref:DUF6482 family protein n=1 Tax=Oceanospirillum beijerinckii TaxID=64976 RepID=UPI000425F75E|nr:DUF6482 family protein [Oceanospirillum beijerinckii]
MVITLEQLKQQARIDKIVIHSIDGMLYQAYADIEGEEFLVVDEQSKPLRRNNKISLQEEFDSLACQKMTLRHQSAYDEMIGQPVREDSNLLEVSLGRY